MFELSDEDRERARQIAADMPAWTPEELDELARIADAASARGVDAPRRAS